MEKKKGHPLARLFFGVFFLLLSAVVLLVNLFRMPGGYDWALGLLDLLTFLGGLLLPDGNLLWCATEKNSREEMDELVRLVKEVCGQ